MESLAGQMITEEPLAVEKMSLAEILRAYVDLTKPRITFMVMLMTMAGFCLASDGAIDWLKLLQLSFGVVLLSSGISTLNQWMERDLDALMLRTQERPLPSGKLTATQALLFGTTLTIFATLYLAILINPLTAILGAATALSYLFLYTPLKTRTPLSTAWGALPGAMPPLVGWAAARGNLSLASLAPFAIMFLWQFPHFLAIAWMYREDYERAGIKMLPVVEPNGKATSRQIVIFTLLLLPVSLLPTLLGTSGNVYFVGAIVLGLGFLYFSIRAAVSKTKWQARYLLLASVIYLPVLFALMVFNR